jgi:hypothetical protein
MRPVSAHAVASPTAPAPDPPAAATEASTGEPRLHAARRKKGQIANELPQPQDAAALGLCMRK